MSTIIGFTGHLGCGKTTAAKVLIKEYGFVRVRFADVLKRMLKKLGLTDEQVDGNEKEKSCDLLDGKTPRFAMQTLGTDWGRSMIDPNIWVRAAMLTISKISDKDLKVVIDDCRFLNEAVAIKEAGGSVIRVLRDGYEGDDHQSEREMDGIKPDVTIVAFDVPELETKVRNILRVMEIKSVIEYFEEKKKEKEAHTVEGKCCLGQIK